MGEAPISGSYWIHPDRLLTGPYPGPDEETEALPESLKKLIAAGVEFFIDLTEIDERLPYKSLLPPGVWYRQFPIPDASTPSADTMLRILNTIDAGIVERRVVYVHCVTGVGRAGTVVGCHMVRYGLNGREALREMTRLCEKDMLQTDPQRWMVEHWCEDDRRDRMRRRR